MSMPTQRAAAAAHFDWRDDGYSRRLARLFSRERAGANDDAAAAAAAADEQLELPR